MDILENYQPIITSYLNKITKELAHYLSNVIPLKNPQDLSNSDLLQLIKIFEENFSVIQEEEKYDFKSSLNTLKEMREIRNKWAHTKPFNPPTIDDIQSDLDCMRKFVRIINGQPQLANELFSTWKEIVNSILTPSTSIKDQKEIFPSGKMEFEKKDSTKSNLFTVGRIYNRKNEIHKVFKGNPNSGISDCANFPYVFLFWSPEGKDFEYVDGWVEPNKIFQYSGGGQEKDMEFTRGNKAVRDHEKNNKELHLFQKVEPGFYKYIGQFRLKETRIFKKKYRFIQFFLEFLK